MAKPGRPAGAYTPYRRLRLLREQLEASPKGLSVYELATRLRVTDRSVRRYLRELQREVDLERVADPDGLGGLVVRIATRDLPRRVKLHRTQIYGLLMARRVFSLLEGTAFERMLKEAMDVLLGHVQRSPRKGAGVDPDTRLEERFLYLPSTPMLPLDPDAAEVVDEVLDACAQLRECSIAYRKAAGDGVERWTIHPYAIVLYRDAIYVVAYVVERGGIRTLRADRIVDADASPLAHFALPEGFSIDAHFAGQFGVHTGGTRTEVVVDFVPRVVEYVRSRRYPGDGDKAARIEPLADGGVRLTMQVGSLTEVRSWVLGFGETAKVVAPPELRESVVAELSAALAHYAQSPRSDSTAPLMLAEPPRKKGAARRK